MALLVACAPVEDLPSQAEQIYRGLAECGSDLTSAEFEACGEEILDGFEMEWACKCDEESEPWPFCGTREAADEMVHSVLGEGCNRCECNRVGTCGL